MLSVLLGPKGDVFAVPLCCVCVRASGFIAV